MGVFVYRCRVIISRLVTVLKRSGGAWKHILFSSQYLDLWSADDMSTPTAFLGEVTRFRVGHVEWSFHQYWPHS